MRIVQMVPLEEKVPPEKYGGTELVVYNLIEEMVKLGHEVYLLGTGDSQTSGTLVPIIPKSLRTSLPNEDTEAWKRFYRFYHLATVLKLIRELKPDIVHNHFGWRPILFEDFIDCPMYTTCHGPITSRFEQYTYREHKYANFISISDNQRKALPEINWVKTIYNGIAVDKFEVGKAEGRDYFAFLGRTSPEKGIKELCQMIKQTDQKLKIAAKVDVADREYFEQEIKPLIDGEQIEFLGEVDHAGKVELLKHAKGLLLWLNWEEPFGLVVVEAMACGTPVLVNKRGSMQELIDDGKTGFLVDSLDEMRERLADVGKISIEECRAYVERRFSARRMAKEYLELAGRLTAE